MQGIELATWALVIVTCGLLLATIAYVVVSVMNYKASKSHGEALNNQIKQLKAQADATAGVTRGLLNVHEALTATNVELSKLAMRAQAKAFGK